MTQRTTELASSARRVIASGTASMYERDSAFDHLMEPGVFDGASGVGERTSDVAMPSASGWPRARAVDPSRHVGLDARHRQVPQRFPYLTVVRAARF